MAGTTYCAAIDLGATSGRIVLGSLRKAEVTMVEVHRFPNAIRSLGAHEYWDIGMLWGEIRRGLGAIAGRLPSGGTLASVGVDTWGHDYALLDKNGRLVFPVHAYRDARTAPALARLRRRPVIADELHRRTGIPVAAYNASLQLAECVANYPQLARTVHSCLFLPDYFNFLLSGIRANELTIASASQLLAAHGAQWSDATLRHFHIPRRWFCQPSRPGRVLGEAAFLPAAGRTKLVQVPGHDTACAFDSLGWEADEHTFVISAGTWSLQGLKRPHPILGRAAQAAAVANERCGDGTYRPLTGINGLWLVEKLFEEMGGRPTNGSEWEALIARAERERPMARSIDITDPRLTTPGAMRSEIDRQLRASGQRRRRSLPAYFRLLCESLALAQANALRLFEALTGKPFRRVCVLGGGARNRLLCRALAQATGLQVIAYRHEAAAAGNLGHQFAALGKVESVAAFAALAARAYPPFLYEPQ